MYRRYYSGGIGITRLMVLAYIFGKFVIYAIVGSPVHIMFSLWTWPCHIGSLMLHRRRRQHCRRDRRLDLDRERSASSFRIFSARGDIPAETGKVPTWLEVSVRRDIAGAQSFS